MILRIGKLISLFLIIAHSTAHAKPTQTAAEQRFDHKALQSLAHDFVADQVPTPDAGRTKVEANNLDPRMVAKQCANEPQISFASNSGLESYTTVEIRCTSPTQWRTYVPVRIYRYQSIVASAAPMSPGHLVTEADIMLKEVDVNRVRANVFTAIDDVVGARIKKRIRSGQPLEVSDTCLVCSGEKVTIVAKSKALTITATGKALADGLKGESVTVKNARSNKALEAVVSGLNEVTVQL